jgi:hypothetical protein
MTDEQRFEAEQAAASAQYMAVFSTEAGKMVLDDLVKRFGWQDIHAGDTDIGVGIKQGQTNVIKYITRRINAI